MFGLFKRAPAKSAPADAYTQHHSTVSASSAHHVTVDAVAEAHYVRGLVEYTKVRHATGALIEVMDPEPFLTSIAVGTLDEPHIGIRERQWRKDNGLRGHLGHPAVFMLGVLEYERNNLDAAKQQWGRSEQRYGACEGAHRYARMVAETKERHSDASITFAQNTLREFVDRHVRIELAHYRIPQNAVESARMREARLAHLTGSYREEVMAEYDHYVKKRFAVTHKNLIAEAQNDRVTAGGLSPYYWYLYDELEDPRYGLEHIPVARP